MSTVSHVSGCSKNIVSVPKSPSKSSWCSCPPRQFAHQIISLASSSVSNSWLCSSNDVAVIEALPASPPPPSLSRDRKARSNWQSCSCSFRRRDIIKRKSGSCMIFPLPQGVGLPTPLISSVLMLRTRCFRNSNCTWLQFKALLAAFVSQCRKMPRRVACWVGVRCAISMSRPCSKNSSSVREEAFTSGSFVAKMPAAFSAAPSMCVGREAFTAQAWNAAKRCSRSGGAKHSSSDALGVPTTRPSPSNRPSAISAPAVPSPRICSSSNCGVS
mmetsp:Transcript_62690/g.145944  ORF Transcript_62690/g.145944 Transcript_62690/m.145944 type:complete len:272 (+) Transcript_62690:664-1479(+)